MNRSLPLTVSLAGLLALSACGGDLPTERNFESVTDLKTAVTEAGVACDGDKVAQGEGYKESLRCGQNVWLTVFEDSAEKQARIQTYEEKKSTYVEGSNWVVVAPQETLDELS